MKKHLLFALAISCSAFVFTSCHDDDDEDGDAADYVCSFSQTAFYTSAATNLSSKAGVYAYVLCDDKQYTDYYHYSAAEMTGDENGYINTIADTIANNYYGGFMIPWLEGDDESGVWTPISQKYYSTKNNALVCNPGMVCRSFFSKHMTASLSSLTAALLVGDIEGLWVCPVDVYNALDDTAGVYGDFGIAELPADHKIEFMVFGYIESIRVNNLDEIFDTIKAAGANIGDGGNPSNTITLAETDANGNVTINKEWQYLDLDEVDDCYIFEAYIRVIDKSTGKSSTSYTIDSTTNPYLGYVMISDITWESKSIF